MPKRGKKYREKLNLVDRDQSYAPEEAIELVHKT
jgi:ribosomal protein L1